MGIIKNKDFLKKIILINFIYNKKLK